MPLYSFRCTGCSSEFEVLTRSGEEPVCPSCGSAALERLISLTAPEATTGKLLGRARTQAAREGHFSNYSRSERPKK